MRVGRLAGIAVGLFGTMVLVLGAIPATRSRTDRIVVLGVVVYGAFVARRLLGVGTRPEPEGAARPSDLGPADEQNVRIARLDASFARAAESGEQFWRVTRPALRRLTAERLRLKTGIDVTADPEGARRQMGEELWEMFATPGDHEGPPPGRERLRVLVERLERL